MEGKKFVARSESEGAASVENKKYRIQSWKNTNRGGGQDLSPIIFRREKSNFIAAFLSNQGLKEKKGRPHLFREVLSSYRGGKVHNGVEPALDQILRKEFLADAP